MSVYTMGIWQAKPGRESEFAQAWWEFAEWTSQVFLGAERADGPMPEYVLAARDWPLVLASLGTLMHGLPGLFEAIIDALGDLPIHVIAAIGRDQDPARFGTVPANVHIEHFVPQIAVLSRCAMFVTHGGFNSAKEALSLRVPLVVIPIGGDQPHTAERCEALGLGRAIHAPERDAAHIRKCVLEVLNVPRFQENVERFSAKMQALPPIEHAVELIERVARRRRPIGSPND